MPTKLFASLGFVISSLPFVVLVLVMYINKRKSKKLGNGVFGFMLGLTFLLLITEFAYILAMYFELDTNINFIKTKPLCYLYLLLGIVWFVTLIVYIWSISRKNSETKTREKPYVIGSMICLIIIMFLISCFLDIVYPTSKSNLYVFSGPAVYIIYVIGIVVLTIIVVSLFKGNNAILPEQRKPIYFCIITLIIINIIQLISDYDYNNLSFLYSFVLTTLYFTIESQDYKLMDDLEKKKVQAEEASVAQTDFLTNMSHEIRTPLNTILGFSDSLLNEKDLNEKILKRDVFMISDASKTLLSLLNNILDISRIESGKEKKDERDFTLQELITDINEYIKPKLNDNVLDFVINVDKDIPNGYYGDYLKIFKIIISIIDNAFKYTSYGNISLKITGNKKNDKTYDISILVSNTGHEMSQENFELDYNEFIKLGNGGNTIDNEVLELIIAKRYISLLEGDITFINKKGEGTKYNTVLPLKVTDSKKVGIISNKINDNNSIEYTDFSNKKVLIVDDNILNLKLESRLLDNYNFKIDQVSSGIECIKKVKNTKYDIIFLDHMMPEMDGVETFKKLKKQDGFKTPVVILTANSYTGIRKQYISMGFYDYLEKPINIKELDLLIKKIFNIK